ncbi:hypothetical protein YK56LOC_09240 [Caballeronia sp. HLA56]
MKVEATAITAVLWANAGAAASALNTHALAAKSARMELDFVDGIVRLL